VSHRLVIVWKKKLKKAKYFLGHFQMEILCRSDKYQLDKAGKIILTANYNKTMAKVDPM
jgi:hypothetical protein